MNKNYLLTLTILTILTLSACGPAPTPGLSEVDAQGTAIANAWVAITQTQASLPTSTATPIPTETSTPLPTATMLTIATQAPPVAAATATENPCNLPPPTDPKGTRVQVKLVNKSEGNVNLSFYMLNPNNLGECGTYTFVLSKFDEPVVTVLAGCYGAWGWVDAAIPSNAQSIEALCVNASKVSSIWIGAEVIGFH